MSRGGSILVSVEDYKQKQKIMRVSALGAQWIWGQRNSLDQDDNGKQRHLVVCADGGSNNVTVLKKMPPRTTYIGRIRKDAKLYYLPEGGGQKSVDVRPSMASNFLRQNRFDKTNRFVGKRLRHMQQGRCMRSR